MCKPLLACLVQSLCDQPFTRLLVFLFDLFMLDINYFASKWSLIYVTGLQQYRSFEGAVGFHNYLMQWFLEFWNETHVNKTSKRTF